MPPQQNGVERSLPHNTEAEQVVLGAVILDNDLIAQVVEELNEECFYNPLYRTVFRVMGILFNSSRPIDPITIGEELRRENSLHAVGGITAITNLTFGLPHFPNIDEYVRILKEKSIARQVVRLCTSMSQVALNEEVVGDTLVEYCEDQLFELSNREDNRHFTSHLTLLTSSIERTQLIAESGSTVVGMPTGLIDLDAQTLGLHREEVTIIAGRPSMGKTSLAMNIAQHVAFRENGVVAFFSLEMTDSQLEDRIICSECNINSHAYRTGRLDDDEWARVNQFAVDSQNARLLVDETPSIGISHVRAKLRRLVHQYHQLDLVLVDYLQLMTGRNNNSREQEVSQISRDLKTLAKEFEVPVIAVAQLNRAPEGRSSHLPVLSDLRESGGIEQDADSVLFLYREDYYTQDPAQHTHVARVIIAKQRNGPTGSINLQFNSETATFRNLAPVTNF